MCGIAGILSNKPDDSLRSDTEKMVASLIHRGPDSQGVFTAGPVALGHTRLSIIDRSTKASQPMKSANGRYILSYNGEVYNFKSLRHQLTQLGETFESDSDTEVVLKSVIRWGVIDACKKFNGMFAFALWDQSSQQLTLARDRFGIKPLYWTTTYNRFLFGSELKALLTCSDFQRSLNEQGFSEYLYYGNALAQNTMFSKCQKLLPGHYLTINPGASPSIAPWWSLKDLPEAPTVSRTEAVEEIRNKLEEAVERHLIADVPVALLLSGGLDSSTLCALASKSYSGKLKTYSIEFDGNTANSELAAAKLVANTFNTEHEERRLSFSNLADVLDQVGQAHDQPFGDAANVPLFIISKELSDSCKVVLQGDGGDEIFGGYKRYRLLQQLPFWKAFSNVLPVPRALAKRSNSAKRLRRMQDALGKSQGSERFAKLLTEEWEDGGMGAIMNDVAKARITSNDPFAAYKAVYSQVQNQSPAQAMLWTDTQLLLPDIFLEKVDRSTMANSVEVRVPFLDTELTDYVMSLPDTMKLRGSSKSLLREAMTGTLPQSIISGPKLGFGVPYGEWLAGPLAEFTRERLSSRNSLIGSLFRQDEIDKLCDQHMNHGINHGFMLYKLLMLAIWSEQYGVS